MSPADFLELCIGITLLLLSAAFAFALWRIVRGPTLADRILALDMLAVLGIGFIATIGIMTRFYLYVDIAIALGLVGFLATIAFARFLLHRGEGDEPGQP